MKIKTFPLQFTEEYLKKIEKTAKKQGKTIKEFIHNLIRKELENEK